jgi:hypothetical protein
MKEESHVTIQDDGSPHDEFGDDPVLAEKKGTSDDQKEMYRMGKPQELRVWRALPRLRECESIANHVSSETFALYLCLAFL